MNDYLTGGVKISPTELFTVLGGTNDIFYHSTAYAAGVFIAAHSAGDTPSQVAALTALVEQVEGVSTTETAAQANANVVAAGAQEVSLISSLQKAGPKYIVVVNLPDVGRTPSSLGEDALVPGTSTEVTALSQAFNTALNNGVKTLGVGIIPVNTFALLNEVLDDPSKYGFVNSTVPACTTASSLNCTRATLVVPNAYADYVFADGVHPTTTTHARSRWQSKARSSHLSRSPCWPRSRCGCCRSGPRQGAAGGRRRLEHLAPQAFCAPADMAIVERLGRTITVTRRILPATAALQNVHDPADHPPVVHPRRAAALVGRQRLQPRSLLVAQPESVHRAPPSTGMVNHINVCAEILLMGPSPSSAQRGIEVSYETIRCWTLKFGPLTAKTLRRRLPRPTGRWHIDEVVIKISGQKRWLWRPVDDEGVVLDMVVQRRRNKKAALRLICKLMKNAGVQPETITTDKLASYGAALRDLKLSHRHRCSGRRANDRAENSHLPIRKDANGRCRSSGAMAPGRRSWSCNAGVANAQPARSWPGDRTIALSGSGGWEATYQSSCGQL